MPSVKDLPASNESDIPSLLISKILLASIVLVDEL